MNLFKTTQIDIKAIILTAVIFFGLLSTSPKLANAFGGHSCTCSPSYCCVISCGVGISTCATSCGCTSDQETGPTKKHIFDGGNPSEFLIHREWLIKVFWEGHILPSLMLMTEQISTVAIQQTLGIGMLFDAKHQLESQRLLQTMQAEAHAKFRPELNLCEIATSVRSLASSERNAEFTQIALADRSLERILLSGSTVSLGSRQSDSESRWVQFKQVHCNAKDSGNGFANLCTGSKTERFNKDIHYAHTIDAPNTLELDFTTDANGDHTPRGATADEEDVLALMANLYGSKIVERIPDFNVMSRADGTPIDEGSFLYMDIRSLAAKRSVAMSALAALAGSKAQGEEQVKPYMQAVLEEMGVGEAEAIEFLSERPSYDLQKKFLTQTLYHGDFFSDLQGTKANVDRKDVAMQAIGLIQKWDMHKTQLRSEMIESVWLDTLLNDLEEKYVGKSGQVESGPLLRELEAVLP